MPQHDGPRAEGLPCWVDLSAPAVDAAAAFYRSVLGWEFAETGPEYGGYRMASRGGRFAAGVGPQEGDAPAVWVLYFAVESADRTAERARELGGTVLVEPFDVATQGRMAVVADPSGAAFGLWQAGEHHGFQVSGEPGGFGWAEVNTPTQTRRATSTPRCSTLPAPSWRTRPRPTTPCRRTAPPSAGSCR